MKNVKETIRAIAPVTAFLLFVFVVTGWPAYAETGDSIIWVRTAIGCVVIALMLFLFEYWERRND